MCQDMKRYAYIEKPKTVEIPTKNLATVDIARFLFWRRAWDSNPF